MVYFVKQHFRLNFPENHSLIYVKAFVLLGKVYEVLRSYYTPFLLKAVYRIKLSFLFNYSKLSISVTPGIVKKNTLYVSFLTIMV